MMDATPLRLDPMAFGRTVVPLVVCHFDENGGGSVEGRGTAFCIAIRAKSEAIFLTAYHNISEWVDQDTPLGVLVPGQSGFALLPIVAFGIQDEFLDIAAFTVDLGSSFLSPWDGQLVPLDVWNFAEPTPGTETYALGVTGQGGDYAFFASGGVIEQVHAWRRDSASVNYPAFQTSGDYMPGMSGGPIILQSGALIGVISRGMGGVSSGTDTPATGYGSLLQPLMTLRVAIKRDRLASATKENLQWLLLGRLLGEIIGVESVGHAGVQVSNDGFRSVWKTFDQVQHLIDPPEG